MIFKFLKYLFGTKKEVVEPTPAPKPKPQHCNTHNRYKKSCERCREAIA